MKNLNKIIYISYYTENTPYEEEINKHLLPSLNRFNLSYDIKKIPDLGSWNKNTAYKSKFIKEMLLKHKCSVIFLDADAEIWKYPILFEQIPAKYDLGIHWLDWYKMWRKETGHNTKEFLSGTMYIPYKRTSFFLIQSFIREIDRNPNIWEQKSMQKVVEANKKLQIYNLPYSYATIILPNNQIPTNMIQKKDIVILHTQASRRLKKRRS